MNTETQTLQDIVYHIATSPVFATDGVCFAARASGLYRSQDGGVNWNSAYDSLQLSTTLLTTSVAVSPGFGARDGLVLVGAPGGILRSEDGGQTWTSPLLPAPAPVISALVLAPGFEENGLAFAATTDDGVLLSTDFGKSWDGWNFGLLDYHVLCLAASPRFSDDRTLFAGTETGIFVSRNSGRAWSEVDFPTQLAPVICLAVGRLIAGNEVLHAGTEAHGIFVSDDCGKNWRALDAGSAGQPVNALLVQAEPTGETELLCLSGSTIRVSRNSGDTWQDMLIDPPDDQAVTCVAAPDGLGDGNGLLVGFSDGWVQRFVM